MIKKKRKIKQTAHGIGCVTQGTRAGLRDKLERWEGWEVGGAQGGGYVPIAGPC